MISMGGDGDVWVVKKKLDMSGTCIVILGDFDGNDHTTMKTANPVCSWNLSIVRPG